MLTSTRRASTTLVTSPAVDGAHRLGHQAAKSSSVDRGLIRTPAEPVLSPARDGTGRPGGGGAGPAARPACAGRSSRSVATTVTHSRPSASRP